MKFLIVEDEEPKREAIINVVGARFPSIDMATARSVRSAIKAISDSAPDFLLLDMSLPTFDIAPGEPGGRPQGEGGVEVLRYMEMVDKSIPTIVITGYDAFKRKDGQRIAFDQLSIELSKYFPDHFKGLIHFDPIKGVWGDKLIDLLLTEIGPTP